MTDQEIINLMARAASTAMLSGRWKVSGALDSVMYGEEMASALDGLAAAGLCITPLEPNPAMIAAGAAAMAKGAAPAEIWRDMATARQN